MGFYKEVLSRMCKSITKIKKLGGEMSPNEKLDVNQLEQSGTVMPNIPDFPKETLLKIIKDSCYQIPRQIDGCSVYIYPRTNPKKVYIVRNIIKTKTGKTGAGKSEILGNVLVKNLAKHIIDSMSSKQIFELVMKNMTMSQFLESMVKKKNKDNYLESLVYEESFYDIIKEKDMLLEKKLSKANRKIRELQKKIEVLENVQRSM